MALYLQREGGRLVGISRAPVWRDGNPPVLVTDAEPVADDDAEALAFLAAPANPAPVEADRHQALLALLDNGITRAMIEAAIAAIADPAEREVSEIRYQQPRWRLDSPFIAWGRQTFNLTETQVAALFALAATK